MKELDLYGGIATALIAGHVVNTNSMTDRKFLEKEIRAWLHSPERINQIQGEEYYEGNQSISTRKRTFVDVNGKEEEVKYLPNSKIVDNQYMKMVDQKTNYLLALPLTFDCENDAFEKALTDFCDNKFMRTIRRVASKAIKGGKAWIFPYYNAQGKLTFTLFPAHEILPFWEDSEHTELDCAVHSYPVEVYNDKGERETVIKVEVFHAAGIDRFTWKNDSLIDDTDAPSGAYITVQKNGKSVPFNWERLPLICFKFNEIEQPLICRVKCLQDALNVMESNYINSMQEDVRSTILVLKNYDGENLAEFRKNLITYGAVKVRSTDGGDGGVDTLNIEVNAENYKLVLDLLKKAIIENARGFDAKDERLNGTPNELNIRSMYSDIDLDALAMKSEFSAAFDELFWFIKVYFQNSGIGNFQNEPVNVIFNQDVLVNESETIDNLNKSTDLSLETRLKNHPYVDDVQKELERIKKEQAEAAAEMDAYKDAFKPVNGGEDDDELRILGAED